MITIADNVPNTATGTLRLLNLHNPVRWFCPHSCSIDESRRLPWLADPPVSAQGRKPGGPGVALGPSW